MSRSGSPLLGQALTLLFLGDGEVQRFLDRVSGKEEVLGGLEKQLTNWSESIFIAKLGFIVPLSTK